VAHCHVTTATSEHTYSHADADHPCANNIDAYFNTDCHAVDSGLLYADVHANRHTDTIADTDAYFIIHADFDANGHTHYNGHGHTDCDGNLNAHADEHAAAVPRQHTAWRTEHRCAKWCRRGDSMRQLH
jgi:hypothetical protein